MSEINPYAATASNRSAVPHGDSGLPTFSVVWLIFDILLCALRGLVSALSVYALATIASDNPLFAVLAIEAGVGLLIAVTGITGNSLLLTRKPNGIRLCWIAVGLTVLGIAVSVAQVPLQMQVNPFMSDPRARVGVFFGAGITLLIRLGLLAAYVVAIKMAAKALRDTKSAAPAMVE